MAELRDVVAYLCHKYPHKQELSKARLSKMVFLAEWRAAAACGQRLTDRSWQFTERGPFLQEMGDLPANDGAFEVRRGASVFGEPMEVVTLKEGAGWPSLSADEAAVLDRVIKEAACREWDDLVDHVCAAYPVLASGRGVPVDLSSLANRAPRVEH